MKLPPIPLVILDTETTGFVPRVHRVIEFACAEARGEKLIGEYEQLFFHDDVPPVVQVLTRIKTADLAGKPSFANTQEEILRHLPADALLVGQNINFDFGMLKGEGIDLIDRPWIDTSMLASLVFPELKSYSLGYLSKVLGLNHNPPHRALGDVRATMELLGKCWERLLMLTEDMQDVAAAIMGKAPKGYRMLFDALPPPTAKKEPAWLRGAKTTRVNELTNPRAISLSIPPSSPAIVDEPLDPRHLESVMEGALKEKTARTWIAVKNLRPVLERLPVALQKKIRVLYPPQSLIDVDAVLRISQQPSFTADEATLALKIAWYEGARRDEMPIHAGEEAVWNGKASSTDVSVAYRKQFEELPSVVLLDHRELLEFLEDPDHPGAKSMNANAHIVIDDASMLEDTATKAFGWYCAMDDLRAAAEGNVLLTKFMDTLQLWVEKTRQFQDIRYLGKSDLTTPESSGMRTILEDVLGQQWPDQTRDRLECVWKILQAENLPHRITWIEQKPNGHQALHSVPERIGELLNERLFKKFPTTLLIPQGSAQMLPEIVPVSSGERLVVSAVTTHSPLTTNHSLPISFEPRPSLEEMLTQPPAGKTIILLPGKSSIEDLYVKHAERLEAEGVTLICQGMSGGMGRMTAEFLAAGTPAIWLLTPWMFEGIDLPQGTVSRLVIKTLPFDHPNHPITGRRASFYQNGFNDYSLPRVLHRLFRILRTYARIRTADGDARLLDERVGTKEYGKRVRAYLLQFAKGTDDTEGTPLRSARSAGQTEVIEVSEKKPSAQTEPAAPPNPKTPKKAVKKKPEDQLTLF